jgi:hypothetical protein
MQSITLGQCFKGAWRDAGRAARAMPALFLVAFVLVFATMAAGSVFLTEQGATLSLTQTGMTRGAALSNLLTSLATNLVQSVVIAVLAVQVIRFAMAADSEAQPMRLWDAGFRRYFLLCVATLLAYVAAAVGVVLVVIVLRVAGLTGGSSYAAAATLAVLAICGMSYVSARLALLFPHTASGGLLQWRAAWRDSRSHFWTISTTAVMVILPVMAVSTVFAVILELMGTDASTGALSYGLLIVQSAATLFYAATTATCSVWLYRRFAAELVQTGV